MKIRTKSYGDGNIIGRNVEALRKARNIKQKDFVARLQICGVDINPTSYSKLEGQLRSANDVEIFYIAKILNVQIEELYKETKQAPKR